MTSATERLRALLTERGVEWWEDAFAREHRTVFDGKNDVRYCVYQLGFELFISSILPVTPEQAVAATLGPGTCEVEGSIIDTYEYNRWEYELSCGHTIIWESSEPPNYCPECGRKVVG